ncbi:hypothetical protein ABI125_05835 [Tamlana crocina]
MQKLEFFEVFFKGRNMHFIFSSVDVLDEIHKLLFLIVKTMFLNGLSVKKVIVLINENTGLYN